jgi:hypothetical protein
VEIRSSAISFFFKGIIFFFSYNFTFLNFCFRMFLLLMNCLALFICDILKQVARVKNTARPMTSEELAAAGVSLSGEEIHGPGNIQSHTEDPAHSAAHDSGNRQDGEIGSEGKSGGEEDL